jgi:hypothetical protein
MVGSTDSINPNALTGIGYIRRPPLNCRYMKAAMVDAQVARPVEGDAQDHRLDQVHLVVMAFAQTNLR